MKLHYHGNKFASSGDSGEVFCRGDSVRKICSQQKCKATDETSYGTTYDFDFLASAPTAHSPAFRICHTLKDAGAAGEVGLALDEIKPDAARVAKAVRDGIGNIPSFKAALSEEQITAIAAYIAKASGGTK